MKIREVKSHVLKHPLPEAEVFGSSKGFRRGPGGQSLLVEIVTDDGLAGWARGARPPALAQRVVENVYKPRLLGRDPLDQAASWHELYGPNHQGAARPLRDRRRPLGPEGPTALTCPCTSPRAPSAVRCAPTPRA